MSDLSNKAAYLNGLADGMNLDIEKTEGKLLKEVIKLLGDITEKIDLIDDEQGFLADKIDDIEDVIEIIGEQVYGDDGEDYDDTYCITCENCGEQIELTDEDINDGSILCPHCGQEIEFEFDCDCDDCDCGHDDCDCK